MNKFEVGDYIKCIDNECVSQQLTLGELYEVKDFYDSPDSPDMRNMPMVINDKGEIQTYDSDRFKMPNPDEKVHKSGPTRVYHHPSDVPRVEYDLENQIKILKEYMLMNVQREDWHSCWDCAIDLQRLQDKLERK